MDFSLITKFVNKFKGELGTLSSEREKLLQLRDELQHAPLNRQDLIDYFKTIVKMMQSESSKIMKSFVDKQILNRGIEFEPNLMGSTLLRAQEGGWSHANVFIEAHLTAALSSAPINFDGGSPLESWFTNMVNEWEWPEGALELSRSERLDEIATLDKKIEEIESKIIKLQNKAKAAGVTV